MKPLTIDAHDHAWFTRTPGLVAWLEENGLVPNNVYRVELWPGWLISYEFHVDAQGRKHTRARCDGRSEGCWLELVADDACRLVRKQRTRTPLTIDLGGKR